VIKELSKQFREKVMAGEPNHPVTKEVARRLTSTMSDLWGDLYPKLEGRSDERVSKEFVSEYEKFERYFYEPGLLLEPDNISDIPKLEIILRKALELLRITVYEW
jgi:hypothetical protein